MFGAHAAHVYGFKATYSAVVLELHAREETYCVCHAVCGRLSQVFAAYGLHGVDIAGFALCAHHRFAQMLRAYGVARCCILLRHCARECDKCHTNREYLHLFRLANVGLGEKQYMHNNIGNAG